MFFPLNMKTEYSPLNIWLQPVGDFGEDIGDPVQTLNLDLLHAQIGDRIKNPRHVGGLDAHLAGEWVVQEREFSEHRGAPELTPRNFTLFIRQP